jgi:predicted RNase H-like HicB family nuclease
MLLSTEAKKQEISMSSWPVVPLDAKYVHLRNRHQQCESGFDSEKNPDSYDGLSWQVVIGPEQQDDGSIIYVASYPAFEGVLGTAGEIPEAALVDLHAARRSMVEALQAEEYIIPEPAVMTSAVE